MMFGDRLRLTGELVLLTDIHLGSGLVEKPATVARDDGTGEIGLVLRGAGGRAVIPGTSLKGALRAAAPAAGVVDLDRFFGPRRIGQARDAALARLWLYAATRLGDADRGSRYRGLAPRGGARKDGFIRSRLGRDAETAAAGPHLLFNEEMVAAGERFGFEALLLLDGLDPPGPAAAWHEDSLRLFQPLLQDEGLGLGAGTRAGEGRARLDGATLAVEHWTIDPTTGVLTPNPRPDLEQALRVRSSLPSAPRGRRWRLKLAGDGPFISIRENREDAPEGEAQIVPLERPDGAAGPAPVLWPSSLLGALRARAGWLAALRHLRDQNDRFAPGRGVEGEVDRRDPAPDPTALSSVERLFGVTGWRGRLGVASLRFTGDARTLHRATSVSVDRLTGGARDGALFSEETFLDPVFIAVLELAPVGLAPADEELLTLLIEDLARRPLFLGHGAAKGFGWFKVEAGEFTGRSDDGE